MKRICLLAAIWAIGATDLGAEDMFTVRQLTFEHAQQGFASWSPDGRSLVYQYTDLNDTLGNNGLWVMAPDGTGARQIFSGVAEHAKWSPDGRFIVFDADTGPSIKMIPAGGGDPISFLPDTIHINSRGLPCWSPDASRIAFKDSEYHLCLYDREGGGISRIFSAEGMLVLPACWTRDGKDILIALMDRSFRKSTIWKISSDGSGKQQITGHHENFYRHLALSHDGSLLIYAAREGRYEGLYIMPVEGGKSLPLAVTPRAHNEGTSWSPDGTRITFTSTRAGSFDVWIMDLDLSKLKKDLGMP